MIYNRTVALEDICDTETHRINCLLSARSLQILSKMQKCQDYPMCVLYFWLYLTSLTMILSSQVLSSPKCCRMALTCSKANLSLGKDKDIRN